MPRFHTAALWFVLAFFVVVGSASGAFVVYGVTGLLWSPNIVWDLASLVGGGLVGFFALLMTAGLLYRVDRLRGVPHRRIELFE